MGGNALTNYTSVRLNKADYFSLADRCVSVLQALYPANRISPVVAYASKSDFGDLDILVQSEGFDPFEAARALGALEVFRNGPVTSIGVKVDPSLDTTQDNVFQVDLLAQSASTYDFAAGYFGFNDLGNLIGRTAHKQGLAFRHDGLYYYFREGDYLVDEICLTTDFSQAITYLGYDATRYSKGFETLNDVFEYVGSGKYFNPSIFLLENRNHRSRVRDRKRKTYMEFLQWCESYEGLVYSYPENKEAWIPEIVKAFPHFQGKLEEVKLYLKKCAQLKEVYSGELVSSWTGLTGKELGALMKKNKERYAGKEEMMNALLSMTPEQVKAQVLEVMAELTF